MNPGATTLFDPVYYWCQAIWEMDAGSAPARLG